MPCILSSYLMLIQKRVKKSPRGIVSVTHLYYNNIVCFFSTIVFCIISFISVVLNYSGIGLTVFITPLKLYNSKNYTLFWL